MLIDQIIRIGDRHFTDALSQLEKNKYKEARSSLFMARAYYKIAGIEGAVKMCDKKMTSHKKDLEIENSYVLLDYYERSFNLVNGMVKDLRNAKTLQSSSISQ